MILLIYKILETFPKKELFALSDQMRRSAISITSNIAEGFGRNSYKEKTQFYSISLGSLTELQNQILIAKDVGYINEVKYKKIVNQSIKCHKLINGLIKSSRKKS